MICCSTAEQIRLPIEMSKQSEILKVAFQINKNITDKIDYLNVQDGNEKL